MKSAQYPVAPTGSKSRTKTPTIVSVAPITRGRTRSPPVLFSTPAQYRSFSPLISPFPSHRASRLQSKAASRIVRFGWLLVLRSPRPNVCPRSYLATPSRSARLMQLVGLLSVAKDFVTVRRARAATDASRSATLCDHEHLHR